MRVAVVHNGEGGRLLYRAGPPSREREDSPERLLSALEAAGHEPVAVEADADLAPNLEACLAGGPGEPPLGVALHRAYGLQGEARYVYAAAVLEALGVPYVGTGPLGHALSLDKFATRLLLADAGLPVPPAALLRPGASLADADGVGIPAVVKPRHESASLGLHLVEDPDALRDAVESVWQEFRQPALVERFVPGREVQVGLLGDGPRSLPPTEIVFADGVRMVTRDDKMGRSGRRNTLGPAALDTPQLLRAQDLAVRAFRALGCRDYARVDMRLDDGGCFWLLETNSLPGLGATSTYPYAASLAGLDLPRLLDHLVREAWTRWNRAAVPSRTAHAAPPQVLVRRDRP